MVGKLTNCYYCPTYISLLVACVARKHLVSHSLKTLVLMFVLRQMVRLLFDLRDACVAVLVGAEPVVESVENRGRVVIVLKEVLINNARLAFLRFRHTDKARHNAWPMITTLWNFHSKIANFLKLFLRIFSFHTKNIQGKKYHTHYIFCNLIPFVTCYLLHKTNKTIISYICIIKYVNEQFYILLYLF